MVSAFHQGTAHGCAVPRTRAVHVGVAGDVLCAGSSAVLLLVPTMRQGFWVLVLLALTPFFYRLSGIAAHRGARLGFVFGLSYFGVALSGFYVSHPIDGLALLGVGTLLLTAYGFVTALVCARTRFNPLIPALLWVGLEAGVRAVGLTPGLLGSARGGATLVVPVSALLGALFVSFLVVYINALVVVLTRVSVRFACTALLHAILVCRGLLTGTAIVLPVVTRLGVDGGRGPPPRHSVRVLSQF